MKINKKITIEELIEKIPASVKYLMEQDIRCVVCGEPIWGTLEEAAKEKGFSDIDIQRFVTELQHLAEQKDSNSSAEYRKKIDINKLDMGTSNN